MLKKIKKINFLFFGKVHCASFLREGRDIPN